MSAEAMPADTSPTVTAGTNYRPQVARTSAAEIAFLALSDVLTVRLGLTTGVSATTARAYVHRAQQRLHDLDLLLRGAA